MTHEDLKARVKKRLETIRRTGDQGVYAKFYEEDVTALLALLPEPPPPAPQPKSCPECGHLKDNIYCQLCAPDLP